MDEILKNYGRKTEIDKVLDFINFNTELGFNPYFWASRKHFEKKFPELLRIYKEKLTEEIIIGQAFGL